MTTIAVVAVARNGVIGHRGSLPWRLPGDLAHFQRLTLGHPLVMGRATYESIGRPLPGRTTIVVTRNPDWSADGVEVAPDLGTALRRARQLDETVFVAGGAQIYAEALDRDLLDEIVLTEVEARPDGDTWFPALDTERWVETDRVHHEARPEVGAPAYSVVRLRRRR